MGCPAQLPRPLGLRSTAPAGTAERKQHVHEGRLKLRSFTLCSIFQLGRKKRGKKNWLRLEGHGATVRPELTHINSQLFAGHGRPADGSIPVQPCGCVGRGAFSTLRCLVALLRVRLSNFRDKLFSKAFNLTIQKVPRAGLL